MHVTLLEFMSQETKCHGTLYLPDNATNDLPCIIMGHGLALTHASGLMPFKEALCSAGYAVFAFDYRFFGDSGGEPRQLLNPWNEVSDWLSAIDFVRQLNGINEKRICLWGTSFSGGLVTVAAAKDGNIQFDVYRGEALIQSIKDQLEFLGRNFSITSEVI